MISEVRYKDVISEILWMRTISKMFTYKYCSILPDCILERNLEIHRAVFDIYVFTMA